MWVARTRSAQARRPARPAPAREPTGRSAEVAPRRPPDHGGRRLPPPALAPTAHGPGRSATARIQQCGARRPGRRLADGLSGWAPRGSRSCVRRGGTVPHSGSMSRPPRGRYVVRAAGPSGTTYRQSVRLAVLALAPRRGGDDPRVVRRGGASWLPAQSGAETGGGMFFVADHHAPAVPSPPLRRHVKGGGPSSWTTTVSRLHPLIIGQCRVCTRCGLVASASRKSPPPGVGGGADDLDVVLHAATQGRPDRQSFQLAVARGHRARALVRGLTDGGMLVAAPVHRGPGKGRSVSLAEVNGYAVRADVIGATNAPKQSMPSARRPRDWRRPRLGLSGTSASAGLAPAEDAGESSTSKRRAMASGIGTTLATSVCCEREKR